MRWSRIGGARMTRWPQSGCIRSFRALDFSRDVLEGQESRLRVLTVPACGWSDLGTPRRVADTLSRIAAKSNRRRPDHTALFEFGRSTLTSDCQFAPHTQGATICCEPLVFDVLVRRDELVRRRARRRCRQSTDADSRRSENSRELRDSLCPRASGSGSRNRDGGLRRHAALCGTSR